MNFFKPLGKQNKRFHYFIWKFKKIWITKNEKKEIIYHSNALINVNSCVFVFWIDLKLFCYINFYIDEKIKKLKASFYDSKHFYTNKVLHVTGFKPNLKNRFSSAQTQPETEIFILESDAQSKNHAIHFLIIK